MDTPTPHQPHGQPHIPTAAVPAPYTDSYGIASIVLALFAFTIPGLVVGLIGASKAKRMRVSPAVSRVGWILNLVFLVISTVILVAVIAFVVSHPEEIKSELSSLKDASRTTVAAGGARLLVPTSFESIAEDYPDADIAQGDLFSEAYVIMYRESSADIASNTTVSDYANLSYQQFIADNGYSEQSRTQLTAGQVANPYGYEIADYRIDATYEGHKYVYVIRYVRTAQSYYTVMSWTMPSHLDDNQTTLYNILGSFQEL